MGNFTKLTKAETCGASHEQSTARMALYLREMHISYRGQTIATAIQPLNSVLMAGKSELLFIDW